MTGAVIAWAALTSTAAAAPSVRLMAADRSVAVDRFELAASLDVGLWVASTGGEFRMRMQRPGYGAWEAAQVDATTGALVRAVPADLISESSGFTRFALLTFRTPRGRVVGRRAVDFCPSRAERVSDSGPQRPSYVGSCQPGFPFAVGTIWGVDDGWATPLAYGFTASVRRPLLLPPGRYRVQAQVRAPFRRLFAIPDEQAQARLRVRVLPDADERRMGGPPLPPRDPHASAALAPVPTVGRPDAATLPDLVALPPWSAYAQRRGRRDELRFAGTPWNAGPAPLLVEGFRRPGEDVSDAFQYFTDAAGAVVGRARAGTMAYHSGGGHDHWHFRQLVDYRMLTRSGRTIVRARKQAFCLVPTNAVDLTRPGARLAPDVLGLDSSACGEAHSIWLRQTLPAGWGDTYPPDVEGQSFDITRVPNGRYLLEMEANPLGALREVSTANNVARRGVVLSGKRGKRRVRMLPWHGVRD